MESGKYMNKILTTKQAIEIANKLRGAKKTIVLAGGCFDILHSGHILYLQKAREQGDILFVFLESDETITRIKGKERPIHTQKDRAKILASVASVDFIIPLPRFRDSLLYDQLILSLRPHIIAATKGDPNRFHKERQARSVDGKVVDVLNHIPNQSTSKFISDLKKQYEFK